VEDDPDSPKTVGEMLTEVQLMVRAELAEKIRPTKVGEILPNLYETIVKASELLFVVDMFGRLVNMKELMRSVRGADRGIIRVLHETQRIHCTPPPFKVPVVTFRADVEGGSYRKYTM
jgi:hypothetical protein